MKTGLVWAAFLSLVFLGMPSCDDEGGADGDASIGSDASGNSDSSVVDAGVDISASSMDTAVADSRGDSLATGSDGSGGLGGLDGSIGDAKGIDTSVPDPDLIGYWSFDGTANDVSGMGNHGVVVEGTTPSASLKANPVYENGKKGLAVRLDGLDDWIRVADSDSIDTAATKHAFTITGWMKVPTFSADEYNQLLNRHASSPDRNQRFGLSLYRGLVNLAVAPGEARGGSTVPLGQWFHIAATFDGSVGKIFLNGALVQASLDSTPAILQSDTTPITIGSYIQPNGDVVRGFVEGLIDEVKLFRRTLSNNEILDMANQ